MLPEPNFRVRPDEFVGRIREIEIFCQALQQGLVTGRTASFAILGDWGIGKSSLLLKFAALCTQPSFAILPVFISASSDVRDYLRLAENLLDKFTDALLAVPSLQARLRVELRDWRFKRINLGGVGLERESPRLFLTSGSSLLRHKLKEAWDHFLPQARLNGAIFFLDDLQNITSISKSDLALTIRDQFQSLGIESMNYSVCFSAKPDYFAGTKALADPAVRFYTKLYLAPSRWKRRSNTHAQWSAYRSTPPRKSPHGSTKRPSATRTFLPVSVSTWWPQRSRLSRTSSKQIGPQYSTNWAAKSSAWTCRNSVPKNSISSTNSPS